MFTVGQIRTDNFNIASLDYTWLSSDCLFLDGEYPSTGEYLTYSQTYQRTTYRGCLN